MKGCKKLSTEEIKLLKENLSARDRCIFVIGIRAGFRIGEILSLRINDVTDNTNGIKQEIYLKKKATKGKLEGRVVPLHPDILNELLPLIPKDKYGSIEPLFRINKSTYWRSLKRACKLAGLLPDRISSHAARKTFAANFYESAGNDLLLLQSALGHRSISSSTSYLETDYKKVESIIRGLK